MEEKKIVIKIGQDGLVNAETFGIKGVNCLDELDKLLKGLSLCNSIEKKQDFYEQKTNITNKVSNKNA